MRWKGRWGLLRPGGDVAHTLLAVTSAPSRSSAHCRLTDIERAALGDAADILGEPTFDIHLNDNARWSNVPAAVWNYRLGGYQILKK